MMNSNKNQKKIMAGISLAVLGGAIAVTLIVTPNKQISSSGQSPINKTSNMAVNNSSTAASSASYNNGSYSATGQYNSPSGREGIQVSLTLTSNVITAVTVQSKDNNSTSLSYQDLFISNYKPYVLGKNINSVHLKNISGSSLTPQGFNDAIKQIEKQAKA